MWFDTIYFSHADLGFLMPGEFGGFSFFNREKEWVMSLLR